VPGRYGKSHCYGDPPHVHINLKIFLLILISGILFILLFVGGPHYHSPRSFQHAWDLGHIICFFVWTLTYLSLTKNSRQTAFFKQCIYVIVVALAAAILIEWIQKFFNRSADARDVMKDLLGCLLALAFFQPFPLQAFQGISAESSDHHPIHSCFRKLSPRQRGYR
jgi:VanZ family protein